MGRSTATTTETKAVTPHTSIAQRTALLFQQFSHLSREDFS
jgi:hypothetical protein